MDQVLNPYPAQVFNYFSSTSFRCGFRNSWAKTETTSVEVKYFSKTVMGDMGLNEILFDWSIMAHLVFFGYNVVLILDCI